MPANDQIQNIDKAIDRIDIVETDSKKGTRYKYVKITLSDGQIVNWYPFLRTTIPQIEQLLAK